MTYEYTHTDAPDTSHRLGDHENDLSLLGKEGWELVCVISRPGLPERAHFKRTVAPPAPPLTNGAVKATTPAKKGTK